MRNSILIFAALAVCGSPRFVMAQPPMHLTLAQAQQLAIQNNPQFTAARYNAAAAYQTAPQYKAAYEPTVSAVSPASAPTTAAASRPAA
jgi:hypothetical protein